MLLDAEMVDYHELPQTNTLYAPSDVVSQLALMLFDDAEAARHAAGLDAAIQVAPAPGAPSDHKITAAHDLGTVAADRVISVVPTPRRGRTGQQPASEASIPTLAELTQGFGMLPIGHAMASGAPDTVSPESSAFIGLMEDDNFGSRTVRKPGSAEVQRQDLSALVDPGALPKWLRESQAANSVASTPIQELTAHDEAPDEEESATERREAIGVASAANDESEQPEPVRPSAADLLGLSPLRPLQGIGISEESVPAQRRQMTYGERSLLQIENQTILLNLVGKLEDKWYRLNSPNSPVPDRFRRGELFTTATEIAGSDGDEIEAILATETWHTLHHDVAAMLHTDERYAEADNLMRSRLGVSLDEFMALGIKSMEGDFYRRQRYAAGLSIRDAIFGYLKSYGFELPIRTSFDNAYKAFGDRRIQGVRPADQPEHRIVSGIDWTQMRSDIVAGASRLTAQVSVWFSNLKLSERIARVQDSGAGVYEAEAATHTGQEYSAPNMAARQQVQARPSASGPARRTPPLQPHPSLGSNPSGVRPAIANSPSRPGVRVPRELTAEELATFTPDQFYEAGHDPKNLPAAVQERLAIAAKQIRAADGFLVDDPASGSTTGERKTAPKPNYL